MSRKVRDMGHPRRSFAYGNVKIENDSITWEMILTAAERKRSERAGGVRAGGFPMPESFIWLNGTTEVVPFPRIVTGEVAVAVLPPTLAQSAR
jgi:hypothetical protein